eukprot:scaffold29051_cov45-Isochrysis_galbana.AAC.1
MCERNENAVALERCPFSLPPGAIAVERRAAVPGAPCQAALRTWPARSASAPRCPASAWYTWRGRGAGQGRG